MPSQDPKLIVALMDASRLVNNEGLGLLTLLAGGMNGNYLSSKALIASLSAFVKGLEALTPESEAALLPPFEPAKKLKTRPGLWVDPDFDTKLPVGKVFRPNKPTTLVGIVLTKDIRPGTLPGKVYSPEQARYIMAGLLAGTILINREPLDQSRSYLLKSGDFVLNLCWDVTSEQWELRVFPYLSKIFSVRPTLLSSN